MNYNIINIILDILALKEWQERMNKINIEYHELYESCKGDVIRKIKCEREHSTYFYYNYRRLRNNEICTNAINKPSCRTCHTLSYKTVGNLSKNY